MDLIKPRLSNRQKESEWILTKKKGQSLMEEQPTCTSSVLVITLASDLWLRIQEG